MAPRRFLFSRSPSLPLGQGPQSLRELTGGREALKALSHSSPGVERTSNDQRNHWQTLFKNSFNVPPTCQCYDPLTAWITIPSISEREFGSYSPSSCSASC